MNIKKKIICLSLIAVALTGCTIKYAFNDLSIHEDVKTFTIPFFPNSAAMVTPTLSATFTDMLQQKFINGTKLEMVDDGGDLMLEGEITGYSSTPTAVTADEYATRNRLTITVRVKYTNQIEPNTNFNKSFSAYEEYDSGRMLTDAEGELIPIIVEKLVDDIFSAALSNW